MDGLTRPSDIADVDPSVEYILTPARSTSLFVLLDDSRNLRVQFLLFVR
jgi:hypothetical protein